MGAPLSLGHSASGAGGTTDQRRPTAGYTNPGALAVGASRQPNVNAPTQIIATINLATGDGSSPVANVQISPDNATWDTITQLANDFDVFGLFGVNGNSNIRGSATFEIPAGWFYRVTQSGAGGTVSITQLRERTI